MKTAFCIFGLFFGIACGAFAGDPQPERTERHPELNEGEWLVTVPDSIQEDLHKEACRFIKALYPTIDKDWLRKECGKTLRQDRYILHVAGPATVRVSVGASRMDMAFPLCEIIAFSGKQALPGVMPEALKQPLTLEEAETRARGVLERIVGDPARARRFVVRRSGEAQDNYDFFDFREAKNDMLRWLKMNVSIDIRRANALTQKVRLWRPYSAPKITYDKAVKRAKEAGFQNFLPSRVYFGVNYRACIGCRVWKYLVPPTPGGSVRDETSWDANTGELVYSEAIHGGTRQKPYRNPTFLAETTHEECKRNIEKLIQDRVAELEKKKE